MKNLKTRIETALVAHLNANKAGTAIASVSIVASQSSAELPDEAVIAGCASANEPAPTLGMQHLNFNVSARVVVVSNANETNAATHQERAEAARLILYDVSGLSAAIAAQDIHVYAIMLDGDASSVDGDRMVDSLDLQIHCVDSPA